MSNKLVDKMRGAVPVAVSFMLLGAVATLVGFTAGEESEARYAGLEVEVDRIDGMFFVDELTIREAVQAVDSVAGSFVADVDLAEVTAAVAAIPAVKSLKVYPGLDRLLHVQVGQRRPVARWHRPDAPEGTPDLYIDDEGRTMPLSRHFTARVPIIHAVDSAGAAAGMSWVRASQEDPVLAAFTDQILVDPKSRDLTLVPRIGRARVVVGDGADLALKWLKLSIFYREQIARGNLNEFKQIRLDYDGQIVATRY